MNLFRTAVMVGCIVSLLVGGCTTRTDIIPPQAINDPILDYPPEAILRRQSGTLVVLIQVDQDGSTKAYSIQKSTGTPVLDDAGMEFIKRLEFFPAVIRGERQACWAEQRVIFRFEKEPLVPLKWRDTTRRLITELNTAEPEMVTSIQERLYKQCTDFTSHVITRPDLMMNRLALEIASETIYDNWSPFEKTFPMSFLMFADFAARVTEPALRESALNQLRQAVEVDIRRIDQKLTGKGDPKLTELRSSLAAFLVQLDQSQGNG